MTALRHAAMRYRAQTIVGAYVCPRGVFAVECRRDRDSLRIDRVLGAPARFETAADAGEHLVRLLASAGVQSARVAIALRGFGLFHHILQLPAASAEVLAPMVERELSRFEPHLDDYVVAWSVLGTSAEALTADAPSAQLAGAVPAATVQAIEQSLHDAGHALVHLTAVPAAVNRLGEEFDGGHDVSALVAALPDGAFMAFFIGGALRMTSEPPAEQAHVDAAALAEEVDQGAVLLGQQFRAMSIDRVTILGAVDATDDAEQALASRLAVPVQRFALGDLSAAAHIAVGAVLDGTSAHSFSVGGGSRETARRGSRRPGRAISLAVALIVLLLAAWTVMGAVQARGAATELARVRRRMEGDSLAIARIRSTAEQRSLLRDAQVAMRLAAQDRARLQQTIVGISRVGATRIRLDSMSLSRSGERWTVRLAGVAPGENTAHAARALDDFYLDLGRRLAISDLALERLNDTDGLTGKPAVRFAISFVAPAQAGAAGPRP